MAWFDETTYVLKTADPERLLRFFGEFGLEFVAEQHGDGPEHWSATAPSGAVFEVYPKPIKRRRGDGASPSDEA